MSESKIYPECKMYQESKISTSLNNTTNRVRMHGWYSLKQSKVASNISKKNAKSFNYYDINYNLIEVTQVTITNKPEFNTDNFNDYVYKGHVYEYVSSNYQ